MGAASASATDSSVNGDGGCISASSLPIAPLPPIIGGIPVALVPSRRARCPEAQLASAMVSAGIVAAGRTMSPSGDGATAPHADALHGCDGGDRQVLMATVVGDGSDVVTSDAHLVVIKRPSVRSVHPGRVPTS
ncbi:hypothetical protein D1007_48095 [Hordeum vulgare]|nr:hypothetical protein D1007_48095 [Hordeum vulgare]KAI5005916.1 hypothetical protein ZWY2020_033159 [Hordeum vulgare]